LIFINDLCNAAFMMTWVRESDGCVEIRPVSGRRPQEEWMRGVEPAVHDGAPCLRKVYPADESARFKCYGSGHLNEGRLPRVAATFAPALISATTGPGGDEAYLERLPGMPLRVDQLDQRQAGAAGARLAAIHAARGEWYGSLDGTHRYADWAGSWTPRWKLMITLVAGLDWKLAADLDAWGRSKLSSVHDGTPPTLVHGDFGPANLLWSANDPRPWVIDWEHARFGHPAEDLAKMRLAELFPEANGFRLGDRTLLPAVEAAWREGGAVPAWPPHLEHLLLAYFAGTLGVFLDPPPRPRLTWLRSMLTGAWAA
jgi:hypothetical protein